MRCDETGQYESLWLNDREAQMAIPAVTVMFTTAPVDNVPKGKNNGVPQYEMNDDGNASFLTDMFTADLQRILEFVGFGGYGLDCLA